MLTSQHLWVSQDTASNGYNTLEVERNLSVYRDWLLSVAQRSVPPVATFLGSFLLRGVGSRGTRAGSWGSESLAEQALSGRNSYTCCIRIFAWVPLEIQHCNLMDEQELQSTAHWAPPWFAASSNSGSCCWLRPVEGSGLDSARNFGRGTPAMSMLIFNFQNGDTSKIALLEKPWPAFIPLFISLLLPNPATSLLTDLASVTISSCCPMLCTSAVLVP